MSAQQPATMLVILCAAVLEAAERYQRRQRRLRAGGSSGADVMVNYAVLKRRWRTVLIGALLL